MNALRVETCMLYMYFKETSLISHASLESSNKESINQSILRPDDIHIYTCIHDMYSTQKCLLDLHLPFVDVAILSISQTS